MKRIAPLFLTVSIAIFLNCTKVNGQYGNMPQTVTVA